MHLCYIELYLFLDFEIEEVGVKLVMFHAGIFYDILMVGMAAWWLHQVLLGCACYLSSSCKSM